MLLKRFNHAVRQVSKTVPLQTVLILPFALQTLVTVGLVGYFSFRHGQQTVNDLSGQLRRGITNRIEEKLKTYTEIPHTINRFNAIAFAENSIDVDNAKGESQFWQQTLMFPSTSLIYCGSDRSGAVLGVGRLAGENSLQLWSSNTTTHNIPHFYSLNSQGKRDRLLGKDTKRFDARLRPWYKAAVIVGQPTWSAIYADFTTGLPTITASMPIYDATNQSLRGVCATDFFLPQEMNRFLESLEIGKSGTAFIMERSGLLVSTSIEQPTSESHANTAQRLSAIASDNRTVQTTATYLRDRFGSFDQIQTSQLLDFRMDGKQQFVQVLPFQDPRGLDWLIVTVLPEADFMERIQANTRITVLLCIAALIVGVAISILTARWITRPLVSLSRSAKALARGEWDQTVKIERSGDLGELAASFNWMAHQLQASFTEERQQSEAALRRSEAKFRRLVESNLIGAIVADLNGSVMEANDAFLNMIDYTQDDVRSGKVNWSEMTPSEYIQVDQQAVEELKTKGVCRSYEKEYYCKNGSRVPVLIGYAVLQEAVLKNSQQTMIGFVLDLRPQRAAALAERQQAEAASILEERNRFAREIHDTLAQVFTGVIMQMETAKVVVPTDSRARTLINATYDLAREGLAEARRSVWALRPPRLEQEGLSHTLQRLVNGLTTGTTLQAQCQIQTPPYPLPCDIETNLLRIVQEATINTLKHANARTISVELTFDFQAIRLRVQDNGDGFNPDHHNGLGFGLVGMRERVQNLGGQLIITSQAGQGTEVVAIVPLAAPLLCKEDSA
ncbi:MAG: HAMP domain-containing protein [Cyanobacteria bacterium CRU_2_1]|nr:HAMP domain-containing protein [Cyanobacteria bacterium RU_5_0]NJR59618.1 HAMP domain-containing protein [Cyanobacteria bacterium CRU_2_1]